jgi:adenylate cyclase class IV
MANSKLGQNPTPYSLDQKVGFVGRNVEIKARITDVQSLVTKAAAIAEQDPFEIFQDDTFLRCGFRKLKLRALSKTSGELIFYERSDQLGPKESRYLIYPTHN